jgi:hypothetical protein
VFLTASSGIRTLEVRLEKSDQIISHPAFFTRSDLKGNTDAEGRLFAALFSKLQNIIKK